MTTSTDAYVPGGHTADDLCERARTLLPPGVFAHVLGGAGDERTAAANRAGFGRYRLLPRVLLDVSDADTSVEILGTKLDAPIFTSPTGQISSVHADGERGVARGAAAAGVGLILSGVSGVTIEDVAAVAGPARWHQLYWQGSREIMADLAARAESAGFRALVLTVDNAMRATRPRMLRTGFKFPAEIAATNLRRYATPEWRARVESDRQRRGAPDTPADIAMTWKNVEWLRSLVRVPFVLKGIMTPRDALRAIDAGVDGIFVSNHGGRNLDGEPGTIEVLEDIVHAVGGKIPVLIDGGVRRASDIAIALGLGAAAVGIGSPVVWALACGGEEIVTAYLEDLVDDLRRTFGLLGVSRAADLTRDHVSRLDQYLPDAALNPFLAPR